MIRFQKDILIIFTGISSFLFSQNIDYIDYLFDQKEYVIARSELYKSSYSASNKTEKSILLATIGYSYQLEGNHRKAIEIYKELLRNPQFLRKGLTDSIIINTSIALFESDYYSKAFELLNEVDNDLSNDLYKKMAVITAEINELSANNYTVEEIDSFNSFRSSLKKPKVALFLSAIMPGAGQFYSNHYFDGLQALFTVGVGALFSSIAIQSYNNGESTMTLPLATVSATGLFYYANMLSGYRTAIYRNMKLKENYLLSQMILFQPLNPLLLLE